MKSCFSLFYMLFFNLGFSQVVPKEVQALLKVYPNEIRSFKENKLFFKDGTSLIYNDFKTKTTTDLISKPDIEDQFSFNYSKNNTHQNDAGRIRNEEFFKKIYGTTKAMVEKNLVTISWCPKLVNQKIRVTTVNEFNKIVEKLSSELDSNPKFKKYISNIGGTFNWRKIAGTNRLSMHSFGMTIDINVKYSDYWQWKCNCSDESKEVYYQNQIPFEIVKIFEKYGFIWGGNWTHFDTMHFEYRPEFFEL